MAVKKRLGEMLLEAGVIDETQLHSALGHQRKWGGKLGQALLDLKLATEPQIVAALARKFGYSTVSVAALPRTAQLESALKLVPRELAMRQTLLPIASDTGSITVAMADPSNIAVVDELSFRTGRRVKIALAGDREIAAAVRRLYFADEEPSPVAAIPLDEHSSESPFETTRDPFAAMPDYIREPSGPVAQDPRHRPPPLGAPPPLPAQARRVEEADAFTPPPMLLRKPTPPQVPPARFPPATGGFPARAADHQVATEAPDLLGEPILATELAPVDEGPFEGQVGEPRLSPRQSAMLDALARAARGEESGLVRPGHLAAVLARLLVKHGILSEAELLDELAKKP